jgi:alpha-1,6-mannosyltransferase
MIPSMQAGMLAILAAISLLLWSLLAGGDLSGEGVPRFGLLYFAAAGAYVLAVGAIALKRGSRVDRRLVWLVLVSGLLFRLVMLGTEPDLSADCWRYVWEGRVQASDINPYAHAPNDPTLIPLRDEVWARVNHPEVPAIYGPLLEALFSILALLPGGLLPFKLLFLACDGLIAWMVWRALKRRGLSPLWILLYVWHPLPILEVAGQAHLELVPVALMLLAVDLALTKRRRLSALVLGLAIAAKYLPVLIVPVLVWSARSWRARVEQVALIALPIAILLIPYLGAGAQLTDGLSAYGQAWRFNDGGFLLADWALEGSGLSAAFCRSVVPAFVHVDPGFDPAEHSTWMRIPPKLAVGALVVLVMGVLALRRGSLDAAGRVRASAFAAGALFVAFSPTVHPWYGLWVLPFAVLPLRPGAGRSAVLVRTGWLYLSLVLPLAYQATVGEWHEEPWVRAVEYGPTVALFAAAGIARFRSGG